MFKNSKSSNLEKIVEMKTIDIGGTPSNILAKNKCEIAYSLGFKSEQLVMILDPFDLSRAERRFPFGENYKVKYITFDVDVPGGNVNLSSEAVSPPNPEQIKEAFDAARSKVIGKIKTDYSWHIKNKKELDWRYDLIIKRIQEISKNSKNLREFMNSLVNLMYPDIKKELLEDIFSKNLHIIHDLIKKFTIPVRAICPKCNTFRRISLGQNTECCNVDAEELIKSGKFIPEEGFFPVLIFLNGYRILAPEGREYINKANKILEEYGIKETNFIIEYKQPEKNLTAFESFILKGLL